MRKYQVGFTIIELMVTLAVLAVVLGLAIPSFNQQILNNSSVALGEDLANAFNYARSEAIKRGARVSICASNNGTACADANSWIAGFIAYTDAATTDTASATVVGEVLKYWSGFDPRTSLAATRDGNNINFVRFTGIGVLARNESGGVIITSKLTGCTGKSATAIRVGLSGSVSVGRVNCS